MKYKDVTLADGREVRLYRPPTRRIIEIVERQSPRPQPPVVTEKSATGKEVSMEISDDPAYLRALAEWEGLANAKTDEMGYLFMFRDIEVPDGWDAEREVGDMVHLFDPDWKPRDGPMGRKLDFIEWDIMGDLGNSTVVVNTLREMAGIDLEEVARNEASFRDQVEGETAQ